MMGQLMPIVNIGPSGFRNTFGHHIPVWNQMVTHQKTSLRFEEVKDLSKPED